MARMRYLHSAKALKSSLSECVNVLFRHGMLTFTQRNRLIDGIEGGDKAAYKETTRRLKALAKRAYKDGKR